MLKPMKHLKEDNSKLLIPTLHRIESYFPNLDVDTSLGLGSWCESNTYVIKCIKSYLDEPEFDRNIYYQEIYKKKREIVSLLTVVLNETHEVNYSRRYWDIMLGPWLIQFISVVYDKWMSVSYALDKGCISGYVGIENTHESLVFSDKFSAVIQDDITNHMLFQEVLEHLGVPCSLTVKVDKRNNRSNSDLNNRSSYIRSTLNKFKLSLIHWLPLITNHDSKYYISHAYLDKISLLFLGLRFGFSSPIGLSDFKLTNCGNDSKRNIFKSKLPVQKDKSEFDKFLVKMLSKYTPLIFVECYRDMNLHIHKSTLPNSPKVIYTASLHLSNDVFRFWAASKVESGTSLMLGQHGGMFGCSKVIPLEKHEFDICDRYVSWGWGNGDKKIIQAGMTIAKIRSPIIKINNKNGDKYYLLIIAPKYPKYFTMGISKDVTGLDWYNYFKEQNALLSSLNRSEIKKIIYRSKASYGNDVVHYDEFTKKSINVEFQDIYASKISVVLKRAKLVVVTYNATAILQLLSSNIPVIAIWNQDTWGIRNEAKELFDMIHSVGILHYDAASASRKINCVWEDVNDWWFSEEVQVAITEFCTEFSRRTTSFRKYKVISRAMIELGSGSDYS